MRLTPVLTAEYVCSKTLKASPAGEAFSFGFFDSAMTQSRWKFIVLLEARADAIINKKIYYWRRKIQLVTERLTTDSGGT